MTLYITTDNGLVTGTITGAFRCAQLFPTIEVADAPAELDVGWTNQGGTWVKSAALLAQEAAEADDTAERTTVKAAYATLKAGTATNAQVQRAVAYLLKRS